MPNSNIFGMVINLVFILIAFVIFIGIVIRALKDKFSAEKTVSAVVIDKQRYTERILQKNGASYDNVKYVVTFLADNKKLYFDVSEFSFDGYSLNQKGKLRYKGQKILEFR